MRADPGRLRAVAPAAGSRGVHLSPRRALFPYQTFGLRHALERAEAVNPADRTYLCNWMAGGGKSLFAAAGAQQMINQGRVDMIVAVTTSPLKVNLWRVFDECTELDAAMIEHGVPAKRQVKYPRTPRCGGVELRQVPPRRRFDRGDDGRETHPVHFGRSPESADRQRRTLARKALDKDIAGCDPIVWTMSASVVRPRRCATATSSRSARVRASRIPSAQRQISRDVT